MCRGTATDGQEEEEEGGRDKGEEEAVRLSRRRVSLEARFGAEGDRREEGEIRMGDEERRLRNSDRREGRKGRKKGMERKWL